MDLRARVIALNEERARVVEQERSLLDATAGRERSGEETQTFERIDADFLRIDNEIRDLVARETRQREAESLREQTLSVFGEARTAQRDAAAVDAFRAWNATPDHLRGEFEIDIQRVMRERQMLRQGASADEIRALAWDASSGSLVVPTTMARSLFDLLEANIAAFQIGATVMNTSTGENMQLPRLKTHSVGTQVASQGLAIGGTDPVLDRVNLNVFKYGQLVRVANELVTDAAFDLNSWLGGDLGYALGRVVDADLVIGTGTSEPTGMMVPLGAGTNTPIRTGGSLIAPTVEKWIDLQFSINDQARRNASWLLNDSTAGSIRKLRDGAGGTVGAFLWEPSLTSGLKEGTPDRFLGSPVYTDTNVAAQGSNAVIAGYGDFSEYVIRTVGNPSIDASTERYFDTDEVGYRAKWRVGGNHRQVGYINTMIQNV